MMKFLLPDIYSKKGQLDIRDFAFAFQRAFLTSALTCVIQALADKTAIDWNLTLLTGLIGGLNYILYALNKGSEKNSDSSSQ